MNWGVAIKAIVFVVVVAVDFAVVVVVFAVVFVIYNDVVGGDAILIGENNVVVVNIAVVVNHVIGVYKYAIVDVVVCVVSTCWNILMYSTCIVNFCFWI